jgi:monoamine oxidase
MIYDTLIIGGGVAGLTVAGGLAERGQRVILFDKWGNWGGRVYTYHGPKGLHYEIGAGRIFHGHKRVAAIVDKLKLERYYFGTDSLWEAKEPNNFQTLFMPIRAALSTLSEETLATHTIAELIPKSLHPLLTKFPYRSEFYLLRADEALKFFSPSATMGTRDSHSYYTVAGGLDAIPKALAAEAKAHGAILKQNATVKDVAKLGHDNFEAIVEIKGVRHNYKARKVIFATCRCSLSDFTILKKTPVLKQTATAPLTRIYAIYPPDPVTGKAWFAGMPNVVTSNPLRFVIPINAKSGLIMISYTDGDDTNHWKDLSGAALEAEIQRCAKELFTDRVIPKPTYLKQHRWGGGCTYWLPGNYNVSEASKAAHNPAPGVYITGESISKTQCWIESALESAETLLKILD